MDAPTPRDFHDWDEEGFKTKILAHFVHFLLHTSGPSSAYFLSMALTGALINTLYYLHRPNLTWQTWTLHLTETYLSLSSKL